MKFLISYYYIFALCVCVRAHERERERERGGVQMCSCFKCEISNQILLFCFYFTYRLKIGPGKENMKF